MTYAVYFLNKEVRGVSDTIMTAEDEGKWLVVEPEGWVPATSRGGDPLEPAPDVKTFASREAADEFMKSWKGHPWYADPKSWTIVQVEPVYRQVPDGYKIKGRVK